MSESAETPRETREPFPYHRALADYLQSTYLELWNWLATDEAEQDYADTVLLELNKTGRPIANESQIQRADSVKKSLGMDRVAVTLWEIPDRKGNPDCSAFWIEGEAHLALGKSFLQAGSEENLASALRSALIRWQFWNGWDGRFRIAERLLKAMLRHSRRDEAPVRESLNRWNRAMDFLADPAGDRPHVPETLRWEHLDLLERERVSNQTRSVIRRLLAAEWFQTKATLAHARQYFPDFSDGEVSPEQVPSLTFEDVDLEHYFCYLLLDFASADRTLGDRAVRECLSLSQSLGCAKRFKAILAEELGWSDDPESENADTSR